MSREVVSKPGFADTLGKPWVAAACLTLIMLAAYPVFALYAQSASDPFGWWAAAVAGFVCWLGALLALIVTSLFRGTPSAIHGILLAMMFRLGLPLVTGAALSHRGGDLARAGVFGLIVGYYLVGLVAETLLSLRVVAVGERAAKAS